MTYISKDDVIDIFAEALRKIIKAPQIEVDDEEEEEE